MYYRNKRLSRDEEIHNIKQHYDSLDDETKFAEAELIIPKDKFDELISDFVTQSYLDKFISYLERLPKDKDLKNLYINYYMED